MISKKNYNFCLFCQMALTERGGSFYFAVVQVVADYKSSPHCGFPFAGKHNGTAFRRASGGDKRLYVSCSGHLLVSSLNIFRL